MSTLYPESSISAGDALRQLSYYAKSLVIYQLSVIYQLVIFQKKWSNQPTYKPA